MSSSLGSRAPVRALDPADDPAVVAESMSRLMRSFARARSAFLSAAQHDVEWSAHVLIAQLVVEGPLRAGALAELVHSDPSTVSRQVAAMVKDGLIERRADPDDGRATLLVATDKGRQVFDDHKQVRNTHFRRMLADWSDRDCQDFARLLARFTADFDRYRPQFFADGADPADAAGTATPVTRGEA